MDGVPGAQPNRYVTWILRAEAGDGPPWPGGFLQWPAYHYVRYRLTRSIRVVLNEWNRADNQAEWTRENPEKFKIIATIERERRRVKAERNT